METIPPVEIDITQAVGTSLRSGYTGKLPASFAKTIELAIDAEQVEFSSVKATHAGLILRSFFRQYPSRNFQFIYRSTSNRPRYTTDTYKTDGIPSSVYLLTYQADTQYCIINALHFRKEQR